MNHFNKPSIFRRNTKAFHTFRGVGLFVMYALPFFIIYLLSGTVVKADRQEPSNSFIPPEATVAPTITVMPTEAPKQPQNETKQPDKVLEYIQKRGGRIDANYLQLIRTACGSEHLTKTVIAISVIESGIGTKGIAANKNSNFFSWFKGGKKYDPTREVMASEICNAMKTTYNDLISESGGVDTKLAGRYVNGNSNNVPWNWVKSLAIVYKDLSK